MATWQYDIHLLPRGAANRLDLSSAHGGDRELLDTAPWWAGYDRAQRVVEEFSELLPVSPTWSPSISMWGSHEGDRIDVDWDNGGVADIYVRIDLRNPSTPFLLKLIDIANRHGLLFVTQDRCVIEAEFNAVLQAIKSSDAFRFTENPEAFLDALERS